MGFQEVEQSDEQRGVRGTLPKFLSPDSGQVEEALGPLGLIERCGKRRQCKRDRVSWCFGVQGVDCAARGAGDWQGS